MSKTVRFLIITLAFLTLTMPVMASRGLTISADKSTLSGEEESQITATLSGFTSGEMIYIKGAFYTDGSTNYFGFTKNGDSWIKNGDSTTTQKQVKIGDWDNIITIKSDFADSGFTGEGDYKLKVGFYYTTSGGNLSSVNWSSNSLDYHINQPDPTPTPSPSPSPKSSPSPSAAIAPKTPTPTPAISSPKVSPEVLSAASKSAEKNQVSSPSPSSLVASEKETKPLPLVAVALIASSGVLFLMAMGAYLWYKKLLVKRQKDEE